MLTATLVFLQLNPDFYKPRNMAVRLTLFPVLSSNNSHNSPIVVSGFSDTSSFKSESEFVR